MVFVDLLQQARAVWWMTSDEVGNLLGPVEGPDGPIGTVVAGLEVEWLAPIHFGQEVVVHVGTTKVGAARFTIWYEIVADGQVVCRARSLMAVISLRTGQILRVPADARAYLASIAVEPAPLREIQRSPVQDRVRYLAQSRWSDCDAYGHINNAQYLEIFQEARIAMFREHFNKSSAPVVVARGDVRFRTQGSFRAEPHLVQTSVGRIGTSSFDQNSKMLADADDPDSVIAEMWTTLVRIGPDGRPVAIPDEERSVLQQLQ